MTIFSNDPSHHPQKKRNIRVVSRVGGKNLLRQVDSTTYCLQLYERLKLTAEQNNRVLTPVTIVNEIRHSTKFVLFFCYSLVVKQSMNIGFGCWLDNEKKKNKNY